MTYSVTYSSGNIGYLTLSKIYYNNPTKPTSVNIKLNGVSFALTYTGQVTSNAWSYSLATIPLSSIGVSDLCTSPAPVIEFYACGVLVSADNIALNPISYVCSGASQQPIVLGTGIAGQFSMQVPLLLCGCGCLANLHSPYYQFRYRMVGTSTWTTPAHLAYPNYIAGLVVKGLASGTYEIQGSNDCGTTQANWVPAPNTFNVP